MVIDYIMKVKMDKNERLEMAHKNHKNGFNCAQAIACVYAGMFNIDEKTAFRITEGLGLGMGAMEACGAVTAMAAVVGMKFSDGNTDAPGTKKACYKKAAELVSEFEKKNSSIRCRDLKGIDTGTPLRSCAGCIEDAVILLEEKLINC